MIDLITTLLKKLPVRWAIAVCIPLAIFGGGYLGGNTAISQQVASNRATAEKGLGLAEKNEKAIADLQRVVNDGFNNLNETLERYHAEGRLDTRAEIELMFVKELIKSKREIIQEIRGMQR